MTFAESATGCVKLPLVTFSVAVETPNCAALVTCGAVKVTLTVQDVCAFRLGGQLIFATVKLLALVPVPGVREMLSGSVVFPVLVMVTTVVAA